MKSKLSTTQVISLGLMLFSMYLGAGNIIFAPMLGQEAGESFWTPLSGFLLTGVGTVFLGILALAKGGGRIEILADRIGPNFRKTFCLILFLALGPLYVIPRTSSVAFEVSVRPLLPEGDVLADWMLLAFSIVFMGVTVFLALNPQQFVNTMGKIVAPTFIVLLALIVIVSLVTPMGEPQATQEPYLSGAFLKGFTDGYLTMDLLGGLVFGGIFVHTVKGLGLTSQREIRGTIIKAGLITVVGLALIHISLAWLGASSVESIGYEINGGAVLAESSYALLGLGGVLIMALVVFLTGVTTNIACISSVSDYLANSFPKIKYRPWVYILGVLGIIFTNFGLQTILDVALPLLFLLYPIAITLVILVLANNWFGGYLAVYLGAMTGAGVVAVIDAVRQAGVAPETIENAMSWLPLFVAGGGWILPGVIGAVGGFVYAKVTRQRKRTYSISGELESPEGSQNNQQDDFTDIDKKSLDDSEFEREFSEVEAR